MATGFDHAMPIGDGKHAVHVTTCDGQSATVRTGLSPLRSVYTTYLAVSVAISEVRINEQRIAPGLSLSWLGCTTLFEHEPLLTDKHA